MDDYLELITQKVKLEIPHFVELQAGLLRSFLSAYPEVVSDYTLFHAPKSGKIRYDKDEWTFTRHGLGVEFRSMLNEVVVDVETQVCRESQFTAWRLASYLESLLHSEIAESSIEESLALLVMEGYLTPRGLRCYSIKGQCS